MLMSMLRGLRSFNSRSRAPQGRRGGSRPRLEALEDRVVPSASSGHHESVTVMTYNLNNGSDLIPLFSVQSPQQIPGAVSQVLAEVDSSNIPARAVALAHVIEGAHPDLVGVQEASVWTVNGAVRYDILGDVMKALAHDGAHYRVASVVNAFGGQLPDAQGEIVGLQDQNAILVRTDLPRNQFQISNVQTGFYTASFSLPLPGLPQPIPALDSWQSVDVTLHGDRFRFFNTHLDSDSPAINEAQSMELGVKVATSPLPVIVVGDFNASAEGAGSPTYHDLLAWGLHDAWTARHHNAGLTWGPTPVDDPHLDLQQRIDWVLAGTGIKVESSHLVGGKPSDFNREGVWPSDHLGVVATLKLP